MDARSRSTYENNPRNNDKAVDAVAASIKEYGFSQPIVVDSDSVIIVGHTRLKAAQKLGLERVPVVVASHLTPEQVRAYRIADNKTAEIAEWNYDLCRSNCRHCRSELRPRFTGFNAEELAKLLDTGSMKDLPIPMRSLSHPTRPSLSQAIFGSSVTIDCYAAIRQSRRTSIDCWPASRFIFAIPIRLTTSKSNRDPTTRSRLVYRHSPTTQQLAD